MIRDQKPERIKHLAKALAAGRLVTDQHLANPREVRQVFLPVAFATAEHLADAAMICAELGVDQHVPGHSYKTWPVFVSCQMLNAADARKVVDLAKRMSEAVEALE